MEQEKRTEKVYTRIGKTLFRRFAVRAAERGLKPPDAFEDSILKWVENEDAETLPAISPALSNVATLPGPFAGLTDDQVWTVQNLIEILKEQPQDPIFRNLDHTLSIAINHYRKTRSQHAAEKKAARESSQPAHGKPTGTGPHHR